MFRNTSTVVAEAFASTFGAAPEGVWSVPGRVSLMGDHTDREDGLSFGITHPARSAVAVSRNEDGMVRIVTDLVEERVEIALDDIEPPAERAWHDYPLGTIWAALGHLRELEEENPDAPTPSPAGLDVFLTTDLPIGGGLASSASLCGAMALAINDLWSLGLDREALAHFGYRVENHFVGATTGMADHVTVLHGDERKLVFYDSRGSDVSLIDSPVLEDEGLTQILVESGEMHRNWERIVVDRHQACDRVGEALGYRFLREAPVEEFEAAADLDPVDRRRAKYVITEIQRVLALVRILRTEGAAAVAHLFNESERSLKEDFEATSERIDLICDLALASGALGARMTGTGFGGSVYVLIPADRVVEFTTNLAEAYAEHGWDAPRAYEFASAPGARRDR
nr:galactokinase family protein [Gulosibacter sp. 10]